MPPAKWPRQITKSPWASLFICCLLGFSLVLWGWVSRSPGWPCTCYVAKADLEVLTLLFLPSLCRYYRDMCPQLVLCGAGSLRSSRQSLNQMSHPLFKLCDLHIPATLRLSLRIIFAQTRLNRTGNPLPGLVTWFKKPLLQGWYIGTWCQPGFLTVITKRTER